MELLPHHLDWHFGCSQTLSPHTDRKSVAFPPQMASGIYGCGFHSFNPRETMWFSLPQAVRDKGLLSAPGTKDFILFLLRFLLAEAITPKWDPHPQCTCFSTAEARTWLPFPQKSKFGFSFLHLESKCFFPPKINVIHLFNYKKIMTLLPKVKKYMSHEKHRNRKTKREKAK